MPLALTIFDCDGVLVDSEALVCRVCVRCLEDVGIIMTTEEVADRYVGISAAAMIADLESRYDRILSADFQETMRDRIAAASEVESMTIDGIEAAIAAQPGRICIASGSTHERVRRCLTIVGLLHHFDPHIFSATQVARGKPAPDLFLFAAREMGVKPEDCLVIEDSIHGVKAAIAANMRVLGFAGASHCRPGHADRLLEAGASATFHHMRELPGLI
ncbi:MAG: HAD family hydrolase [Acetobacteraceae bacterium]|jgi:HAD superfamily hydrolase (TIGR01509 family)